METFAEKLHTIIENNHKLQATLAKNDFVAADAVMMTIDMNDHRSDFRRIVAEGWCQANAKASKTKWRRRIIERIGEEVADRVLFEFERQKDADGLRDFLAARKW